MNRFTERELTAQEYAYLTHAARGDGEAQILLLESRRLDPKFDIRSLEMTLFMDATDECIEQIRKSAVRTNFLIKQIREHKRGMRQGKARRRASGR